MKAVKIFFLVFLVSLCALSAEGVYQPVFSQEHSQEQELFFIAQKAFDDGFYDVAIRYIEQFFQRFPSSGRYAQARLLLGQCYFFKNQYLKALEVFQSLQHAAEIKDAVFYWLGETYFKGADYRQAQIHYAQVIERYPDSEYVPQAYYSLGWSSFAQGHYEEAVTYFETLARVYPGHTLYSDALFKAGEAYLNLGQHAQAVVVFEKYIAANPKSPKIANAFFYLGEGYYYAEDLLAANTYYAKAAELADNPRLSFMAHLGMGWIYLKLQKHDLSESHFEEAGKIAGRHSIPSGEILLGTGALKMETQRFEEALQDYNAFLKSYPESGRVADALIGRANVLYALERHEETISAYHALLDYAHEHALSPDIIEKGYYGIAWTFLKQGSIEKAVQAFQEILEKSSSRVVKASALTQIGDAYQDANQFPQALMAYDRVLKEFSEGMYADYAQFQQGITFLKMGNEEAAKFSFQSLKKNFPQSSYVNQAEYYLGFAYFQNQEWSQAARHIAVFLESASEKNQFTVQAKYILALSYFHDHHFSKALVFFQDLLKDLDDQPSIKHTAAVYIGKSLYHLDRTADAVRHFRQVCQDYPLSDAHQDALLWLGSYYLDQSDFNSAVIYYQTFIDKFLGSDKIDIAHYELGQCYYGLGDLEKAVDAFRQIQPGNSDIFAKAKIAIADIFSRDADSQQAIESYRKIAEEIPEYRRDALVKIAKIQGQMDDARGAVRTYQQALDSSVGRSAVSDAELIFAIADQYELLNQNDQALEEYLRIPYLHPQEDLWVLRSHLRVARIFENMESWDQARVAYEKIIELDVDESKYAKERLEAIKIYMYNQP